MPLRGNRLRTISVQRLNNTRNYGMAISEDGSLMAVSSQAGTITLYSLPSGTMHNSFPVDDVPVKLCFTAAGDLLLATWHGKRIQHRRADGALVKMMIGDEQLGDGSVWAIAAHGDTCAVGKHSNMSSDRVLLYDITTGALIRKFCAFGTSAGSINKFCQGMRFSADGTHILVAEGAAPSYTVSVFTVGGVFVKRIGEGVLQACSDVELTLDGAVVASDHNNHRVCVFSGTTGELMCQWGNDGTFNFPEALAYSDGCLYVLDRDAPCVHVFE